MLAFPLGVWFGILAWRTNSIWPGVAGHMFVNAFWNIWGICAAKLDTSDISEAAVTIIAAVCGVAGLVGSIIVLVRMSARGTASAVPVATAPAENEPGP
jgi:membrane protease YdiL (CAAX protease family)